MSVVPLSSQQLKTEHIYKLLCYKESFITQLLAEAAMGTKVFVFIQLQGFEVSMVFSGFQEHLVYQHQNGESKQDQFFSIAWPCQL